MPDGNKYIVCVYLGEESVPSVMRECCECGKKIAMDRNNESIVADREIKPICWRCGVKLSEGCPDTEFGALDGGVMREVDSDLVGRFRNYYEGEN